MKTLSLGTALLALTFAPALAGPNYETPQYSGPAAAIESRGMGRDGTPPAVRSRRPLLHAGDDTGFENRVESRNEKIQSEMDRRRDEVRRLGEFNE